MKKVIIFSIFCLLVLTGIIIGCSQGGSGGYGTTASTTTTTTLLTYGAPAVTISGFAFNPSTLMVSPETTVVWTNNDSVTHTVTSTSGPVAFDSGNLGAGVTYSHKFSTVGTYEYQCNIHTYMKGTLVVK